MAKRDTQGFDIGEKTAAVIGCGGLGCNVAVHLAGAGIGTLYLCDFDTVSETNLNRQFLYTPADIGRKKTEAMRERLSAYAPECRILSFDKKIETPQDIVFSEKCDVIVIAADNVSLRKCVQEYCFTHGIPFVNGGISGYYGVSYLCVPGETPCLSCAGLTDKENTAELSVSAAAGVIGAHCACLAQKYLCGEREAAGKLFVFDDGEITALDIRSKKNCRFCGVTNNKR